MVPTTLMYRRRPIMQIARAVINANATEASPRGPNQPTNATVSQSMRDRQRGTVRPGRIRMIGHGLIPSNREPRDGTKGDCQRKAESEEPYATAEIGAQLRYADSAGVGEQHPHQRLSRR